MSSARDRADTPGEPLGDLCSQKTNLRDLILREMGEATKDPQDTGIVALVDLYLDKALIFKVLNQSLNGTRSYVEHLHEMLVAGDAAEIIVEM
jgi:hypothetical protein